LSQKNAQPALLQLLFRIPLPAVPPLLAAAPQPLAAQLLSEKLAEKSSTTSIDIPMFLLLRKSLSQLLHACSQ